MNFTDKYYLLKEQWYLSQDTFENTTGTRVKWVKFFSGLKTETKDAFYLSAFRDNIPGAKNDEKITENRIFEYPVFIPKNIDINSGAILLLHGLNERRWDKYLCWADYLATKTGKSVILFPISFHLNRSLPEWSDRQVMMKKAIERKSRYKSEYAETTFINEALSERLTEVPERFFLSGLQTANDLLSLIKDIYNGEHPLFSRKTHTNIFAYSIGGLLAQVLFIANPDEYLSNSKLFLFCAGSLFHEMNGISKLIMDPVAYHRIYDYYTNDLEFRIKNSETFSDFFNNSKIGMAFRSMIAPDRLKSLREKVFQSRKEHIYAISMKNDRVIPTAGISKALMGNSTTTPSNMEVMDFSFPNYHEMPFPVKPDSIRKHVDEAFEKVFSKAAAFLC